MSEMTDRIEMTLDRIGQEQGCRIHPSLARLFAVGMVDAMREPTGNMLLAGHGANLCDNALEVWQAMIDEARK